MSNKSFIRWFREEGQRQSIIRKVVTFEDRMVELAALPAGAVVRSIWLEMIEPFDAEENELMVGTYGEEDLFITPSDITNAGQIGVYPIGGAGPFARLETDSTVIFSYNPVGSPAAGQAEIFIDVALP